MLNLKLIKINYSVFLIFLFYLFSTIILYMLNLYTVYNLSFYKICFFFSLSLNLMLLIYYFIRRESVFLIFFGFITLYALPYYHAIFYGQYISWYHQICDYQLLTQTLLIYTMFLIPFIFCIGKPHYSFFEFEKRNNVLVFFVLVLCFFFCWSRGLRGDSILVSGSYENNNAQASSLYEYDLCVIFLMYIFSGHSKKLSTIFYICCFLYAIKSVLYGGRIVFLMLCLLLYLLVFQKRFSYRFTIILFFIGIYVMNIYSKIRNDISILFDENIVSILNPFTERINAKILYSNEGDVFWAGERILLLINSGYLNISNRIKAGVLFILSPFVPVRLLGELGNLTTYKRGIFPTGGGGLGPLYMYAMFSYVGVFLFGFFISKIIMNISKSKTKRYLNLYVLFIVITLPRWFAYYPIHVIKLSVISVIFYFLINLVDSFSRKYII